MKHSDDRNGVRDGDDDLVVVIDTLVDRVHFAGGTQPADVGYKALAVNLSDLAAMGAAPERAIAAVCHPDAHDGSGRRWLAAFEDGMTALAEAYGMAVEPPRSSTGPLSVTVEALGRVPQGAALRRDGAAPGDGILVTGTLGDAGLALSGEGPAPGTRDGAWLRQRLRRPQPRVAAGLALRGIASAAIDVSDGLAADLGHILAASGVGARLQVSGLPLSEALAAAVPRARGWALALGSGDDYELCCTIPAPVRADAEARLDALPCAHAWIGEIVADPGLRCLGPDGAPFRAPGGYRHFP